MDIHRADDWYAQGFRTMLARDVFENDEYLFSFVETVIVIRCMYREYLHNGYVDLDGTYHREDAQMWVRKNS